MREAAVTSRISIKAPISTPAIRNELELGQAQWLFFETAILRKPDDKGMETVATTSERLAEVLEKLTNLKAKDMVGTSQQWRAFYGKERPCMADLLVDSAVEKVSTWYSGKYRKSALLDEAYEATDFFPDLGESGRWLRFTAAVIRDSRGELVGAVETLEDITEQKLAEDTLKRKGKGSS